ncbi:ABC-2 type transport system ATP-binding protein [Saccharomonospora amisosensis]|uniref:ABC-2 type transport system ATP-binding protein n=1 Tax=Saccharomonospora amisosensis TaxID=1128677 RepID=A0A7X5ZR38_9PSEU|nr:ABC transporter ATP-binding protein [Saccharomonospora amisosensis]NIJ12458.1 ABC-2 type transport system ATP-binding protein [Saccharomonospora amisosensis]
MMEPPVSTRGLSKTFGDTVALSELDLDVRSGEIFGYLGPNGAGKTTTLRLLLGMLKPLAGKARILGHDCWREQVAVHRLVGYLPGDPALYGHLTGAQHVEYFGALRGGERHGHAAELAQRLGLDLRRAARTLSRGNRQKLGIVLALMSRPELLVLDEPSSGLDPIMQRELHGLLREHTARGGAVLLSSHVLAEVQRVADRIGILRAGRLIAVERIDELRSKSLHRVSAWFSDEVAAAEFAGIPGVRQLEVGDRWLTCGVPRSALDDLLKRISRHPVMDLECVEAGLEETFLAYYAEPSGAQQVRTDAT